MPTPPDWPIPRQRSIIWAADLKGPNAFELLFSNLLTIGGPRGLGAVKVGMTLTERFGLSPVVKVVHDFGFLAIWDHQKAGTDIPDMGEKFAELAAEAEVDAVIIFPLTGPVTQRVWTEACMKVGVPVIIGGDMTHVGYLARDGGYIADGAPERMYGLGVDMGVRHFVVPGNKPEEVTYYREQLESWAHGGVTLYAPGFVAQGGEITEAGKVAGTRWHAIVGRGITNAEDPRATVEELASQLG